MTGRNFPLTSAARRSRAGGTTRAVALATVLALGATACNDEDPETIGNTPNTSSPAPTSGPSDDASAEPTPGGRAVGVYLVGSTPAGQRLFREFHKVDGDRLTEAAKLVDGGDTLDPDYRTLWPGQTVSTVTQTSSGITVELNGDAFTEAPDGMTKADAELAIQQMVYTLQGVAGDRLPVTFSRGTGPAKLFGVDVRKPVTEALWNDVLAHVSITTPASKSVVVAETLVATGVASAYEATVHWSILEGPEPGGSELLAGHATADGWMDKLYPWKTEIDVSAISPGIYTFVARDFELGEGEEGNAPTQDSKTFTVR